jgi:hypothetical protein
LEPNIGHQRSDVKAVVVPVLGSRTPSATERRIEPPSGMYRGGFGARSAHPIGLTSLVSSPPAAFAQIYLRQSWGSASVSSAHTSSVSQGRRYANGAPIDDPMAGRGPQHAGNGTTKHVWRAGYYGRSLGHITANPIIIRRISSIGLAVSSQSLSHQNSIKRKAHNQLCA